MANNTTTQKQNEALAAKFTYCGVPQSYDELLKLRGSEDFARLTDYAIAEATREFARRKQILDRAFQHQEGNDLRYISALLRGDSYTLKYSLKDPALLHDAVDAAVEKAILAQIALDQLESLYEGWTRFFLVTNANGHVHKSTSCSTCFWSTEFAWLPLLSGSPESELIDHFGTQICTVCYPEAPTDPRWADAAKREQEKASAGLCPESGKFVRYVDSYAAPRKKWHKCECGESVTLTAGGKSPKHKTPEAKAEEANAKRIAKNEAAGRCIESGDTWGEELAGTRTRCHCGKGIKITDTGKVPAHKAPKA